MMLSIVGLQLWYPYSVRQRQQMVFDTHSVPQLHISIINKTTTTAIIVIIDITIITVHSLAKRREQMLQMQM